MKLVYIIHTRTVPCTILDLTAGYNIFDDVNLDEFAISQGKEGEGGVRVFDPGLSEENALIPHCTLCNLKWQSL